MTPIAHSAFAALRQFAARKPPLEKCDFCGTPLQARHEHLLRPSNRELTCVCDPCATLFGSRGETALRRVPRRILYIAEFRMTDAQWESLTLPINLAYFVKSSGTGRMTAFYPSPAGPME